MKRMFRKLPPEFLRCRVDGHRWDEVSGLGLWRQKVTYLRGHTEVCRCASCGSLRRIVWSEATGVVLARAYRYAEGYALARSELPEGVTMREAMRVEWAARSKAGDVRRLAAEAARRRAAAQRRATRRAG